MIDVGYGFSVRVFVPPGYEGSVLLLDRSNWIGRVVVCFRDAFPRANRLADLQRAGVYILFRDGRAMPRIYIGEGDPVMPRIWRHAKKGDWERIIAFTSRDDNLNKAHIQHIEARLIRIAQQVGRCDVVNRAEMLLPSMSPADQAEAEEYLRHLLACLPLMGVNVFQPVTPPSGSTTILKCRYRAALALGYRTARGFVVLAGSTANVDVTRAFSLRCTDHRNALVKVGTLVREGDLFRFTRNHEFRSPSMAASLIAGNPLSGLVEWRADDGRCLRDLHPSTALLRTT